VGRVPWSVGTDRGASHFLPLFGASPKCGRAPLRITEKSLNDALQAPRPARVLNRRWGRPFGLTDWIRLLEGKRQNVRLDGRVVVIRLFDGEGMLEWDLEVGGRCVGEECVSRSPDVILDMVLH
jgi:hypothetical protein